MLAVKKEKNIFSKDFLYMSIYTTFNSKQKNDKKYVLIYSLTRKKEKNIYSQKIFYILEMQPLILLRIRT